MAESKAIGTAIKLTRVKVGHRRTVLIDKELTADAVYFQQGALLIGVDGITVKETERVAVCVYHAHKGRTKRTGYYELQPTRGTIEMMRNGAMTVTLLHPPK